MTQDSESQNEGIDQFESIFCNGIIILSTEENVEEWKETVLFNFVCELLNTVKVLVKLYD